MISPRFSLTAENVPSLLKSAGISVGAVVSVLVLKFAFPENDFGMFQTAVLTAVCAWVVNTLKEFVEKN